MEDILSFVITFVLRQEGLVYSLSLLLIEGKRLKEIIYYNYLKLYWNGCR